MIGHPPLSEWSAWQPVPHGLLPQSPAVLAELLDGGQAFRWHLQPDGDWLGVWSRHIVRLRQTPEAGSIWSAPLDCPTATDDLIRYFAGNPADTDSLPWRSDARLAHCLGAYPGLRILRQPFGETLLGFLCSATKQIVQIKQMLNLLATTLGAPISQGIHALPTWDRLATADDAELKACLLGFRARYIRETARFLRDHPGWLKQTECLPYLEAKTRLISLPGVGEKVADCVLLFGAGRLEAFPVDTWIIKVMARHYGLDGWTPAQIAHFGRVHFGPHAGFAQQFLFATERAESSR